MAEASFVQSSFLSGLWSERAQGRMDRREYKEALNVCTNYYPVDSACLVRRQGTRFLHHTRRGQETKLKAFDFTVTQPYQLEISANHIRFTKGLAFVHPAAGEMALVSISTATPAVVTVSGTIPSDWATEDDIIFELNQVPCSAPELCGRQFTITKISSTTFSLRDAVTGLDVAGSGFTYAASAVTADFAKKIFEVGTPYIGDDFKTVNVVQDDTSLLLLHEDHEPELVTVADPAFAITQQLFDDGPYFDENETTTTLTPSGTTGSINLTMSSIVGVNGGQGWLNTDVGRIVRFRGTPPTWSGAVTYDEAQNVTGSDGAIYTSISGGNLNNDPTSTAAFWVISPTGVAWTWARITAWTSTTVVVATILGDDLGSAAATVHWRLGLYSDTTGWPTAGAYHEDRLFLNGPVKQRVDGSKTGKPFDFSPTGIDGAVADDNAVSATADATDANALFWARSRDNGIFWGSQAGVWRIRASTNDDPISPSSIQFRRVTKVAAAANIEPAEAPAHLLFVQRHKRKIMEFGITAGAVAGTGVHSAPNLSQDADHLTKGGIEEIAYQHEPVPIMWSIRADGRLLGMTYKRDPGGDNYTAWHEHVLGTTNAVTSISTGPSHDGLSETLHLVTRDDTDANRPKYAVEALTPLFDDALPDERQWFVDGGLSPCCATLTGGPPATGVTIYGGQYYAGSTICVAIGGLDLGDYVVASDGSIAVVFGTPVEFTEVFLSGLSDPTFGIWGTPYDAGTVTRTQTTPQGAVTMRAWKGDDDGDVTDNSGDYGPWNNAQNTKYLITTGSGAPGAGLRRLGLTGDGEEILATSLAEMNLTGANIIAANTSFYQGYTQDKGGNGRIYFRDGQSGTNSPIIRAVDPLTHKLQASFGVSGAGSGLVAATPFRAVAAAESDVMAFYDDNGKLHEWIIQSASVGSTDELTFINTKAMWWAGVNFNGDEPYLVMSGRPTTPTTNYAVRYVIGMERPATYAGGLDNTAIGVYKVVITNGAQFVQFDATSRQFHISVSKIGTFSASDIDATWTSGFRDLHGFALDETDGQLIGWCSTTQAVSVQEYLFKIDPTDASITWAVEPSQAITPSENFEFRHSKVQYSTYMRHSSGGSGEFLIFDTTDGSETTVSFTGITINTLQQSDDETMSIHADTSYSDGGTPSPTVLGTYMPDVSNIFTTEQTQLWPGVNSTTNATGLQVTYTVPTSLGFCYTSKAQILRPDAGNDAGARNGPAFGKLRRVDNYAAALYRTQGISFGIGFGTDDLFDANLITDGNIQGSDIDAPTLFSGIHYDTLESDMDFENMISWQQTRVYNGTVTAVAGFVGLQDK